MGQTHSEHQELLGGSSPQRRYPTIAQQPQEEWIEEVYRNVIASYQTATHPDHQTAMEPTCFEQLCCQAYFCNDGTDNELAFSKLLDMTVNLIMARYIGLRGVIKAAISNLFTETPLGGIVRLMYVIIQFLIALALFLNVVVHYSFDQKEGDKENNYLLRANLVINCIIMFFTSIDFFYNIYYHPSRIMKRIKKYRATRKQKNSMYTDIENETFKGEQPIDPTQCCQHNCKCCPKDFTRNFDFARLILVALLIYPDLIISVLQFSKEYVDKGDNRKNISACTWIDTIFGFGRTAVCVYLMRVYILVGMVWSIMKVRKIELKRLLFLAYFVVYFCLQMLIQVFMIIAIGVRFSIEYRHAENREDYSFSYSLWYMIIMGFLLPIVSTLMFFIVHHFWTQRFLMEFSEDVIPIVALLAKDPDIFELHEDRDKLFDMMHFYDALNTELSRLVSFDKKFLHAITTPLIVILCYLYFVSLFIFSVLFLVNWPGESPFKNVVSAIAVVMFAIVINWYVVVVVVTYINLFISLLIISLFGIFAIVPVYVFCTIRREESSLLIVQNTYT